MFKNHSICLKTEKGFTLIELLVVIAIIGILSSVIVVSVNAAREKSKIAFIKSNLRNMLSQAGIFSIDTGGYSNLCLDANMLSMKEAIVNRGGTVNCFSTSSTTNGLTWAVSAFLDSDNKKNYSVDQNGVVIWDETDISSSNMVYSEAKVACANVGKRLPSIEELKTLREAYNPITTDPVYPPIFGQASIYWSNSIRPASGFPYVLNMVNTSSLQSATHDAVLAYVHCVSSN